LPFAFRSKRPEEASKGMKGIPMNVSAMFPVGYGDEVDFIPIFLEEIFHSINLLIDYNNFQPKATCQTLKNTPLESIAETSDH